MGTLALLAGAISFMLGESEGLAPGEMPLPTPCLRWDLAALLAHLAESMADLAAAIRTGELGAAQYLRPSAQYLRPSAQYLRPSALGPAPRAYDPVEALRDRAAELLCVCFGFRGEDQFVAVGGVPMPGYLLTVTGAVEIAVHGWDASAARGRRRPIPPRLATRMLGFCPLIVTEREGLFAAPVVVPADASPGDRLIGFLGRDPKSKLPISSY